MTQKINWLDVGKRLYETGIDRPVLYPQDPITGLYPKGYAWDGLIGVTEKPSGAEPTALYAQNTKYLVLTSLEEFAATIEAYAYPDIWGQCDGTVEPTPGVQFGQQDRLGFGLCYRTMLGNDVKKTAYGYKLHLIYGGSAAPSEKAYSTINESPEAMTLTWEVDTTPIPVPGYKPMSLVTIDSTKVNAEKLAAFEAILYGTAPATEGRMPTPTEIVTLMTPAAG